eukprot:362146-Chlamydomonas_euryale.AAC.1
MAARVANSGLHAGCTGVHGRPASACRMDRGTRPMKLERPAIPGQLRRHRVTASALTVRRPTMYSAATYAASAAAAAAAASGGAAAAAAAAESRLRTRRTCMAACHCARADTPRETQLRLE